MINKDYEIAKERYAELGVDTEKVLNQMQDFHLSLHCWQTDDVIGFENLTGSLSGGIATTGNYPGRARNIDEVRADIIKAKSLIPGTHRLNLHEIYGDFKGEAVDRDQVEPKHFASWIEWGKENNMKLDFNSTSFSHPKSGNLSLANPDEGIRNFWIEHTKRCRAIAEEMGKAQGDPCIMNLWVHDGSKDMTVNKLKYRELLKDSLDQIFATKYDNMKDCIESKVFGIGLESYTVGSNDFYTSYAAQNNKMITLDTGHFHPTESVADKVSAMLLYVPELMLHVSRPIRWDSDHVTIMDDPTLDLFSEIVRAGALDRVHYGLDYFDASINRIGAYVVGSRAAQKCMLRALLEPLATLRKYEDEGKGFERLALLEEAKAQEHVPAEFVAAADKWMANMNDSEGSKEAAAELKPLIAAGAEKGCPICKELKTLDHYLVKRSQWIIGGDGASYDIGYGGLDHVLASGEDVNILVLDTEVYSNTGGQSSKSTPLGAIAQFAAQGKRIRKKDLGLMQTTYGYIYVAQVAMGADNAQTLKAIREAEAYPGPSLIIAYAPCINHGLKRKGGMGRSQHEEELAVECGYWHLWRYNPLLADEGKNPFTLDSKAPNWENFRDFLLGEVRYLSVQKAFPKEADELFSQAEKMAKLRYQTYVRKSQEDWSEQI